MDDKKMLELAAKADGRCVRFDDRGRCRDITGWHPQMEIYTSPIWNPLGDDGDAYRLLCSQHLNFRWDDDNNTISITDANGVCRADEKVRYGFAVAGRLAITRAAAQIGEGM